MEFLRGLFPNRKSNDPPEAARVRTNIERLTRILQDNLLPFWRSRAVADRDGGYCLNHDPHGVWRGDSNKRLVVQARTLWFFSYLSKQDHAMSDDLAAAKHGFDFLAERMWDHRYGGFVWETDSKGESITKENKHLFAQACAIYGLAEYFRATRDPAAINLLEKLFGLLEDKAHDAEYGGYVEVFSRDWKPAGEKAENYLGAAAESKLMNTHLHLLEAFTLYYSISKQPLVRERLLELIMIQTNAVLRKRIGAYSDEHFRNWEPLHPLRKERISYGHNLENTWLLMEACTAAGIPQGSFLDLHRTVFDYCLRYGYDTNAGGFFAEGPAGKAANKKEKIWWVQAEALVCCLKLFLQTREGKYFDCFEKTLEWISRYQVDWKYGEWHPEIDENQRASGDKTGPWKSPYHTGRAMLECLTDLKPVAVDEAIPLHEI